MKKRFALLIAVVLVLVCYLTACQSNQTQTTPNQTTTTVTNQTTTAATTTTTTAVETGLNDPNVNLPGTIPVLKELTDIKIGISADGSYLSWTTSAIGDWVKEKSNVNIVWEFFSTSGDEARQQIELLVASNAVLPEIIHGLLNDSGRDAYGAAGYLVELTPYFEKQGKFFYEAVDREEFNLDDMTKYAKSPDGGLYGVPSFGYAPGNYYSNRAWIATPFLEALGMENPKNADELYEYLKGVKTMDPNRNGEPDEIGIIGSINGWNGNPLSWMQNMFIYCDNTDNRYIITNNGELDVSYDKPEYQEFLKYARKLCDEGLLDALSFTQDYDTYLSQVTAPELIVGMAISGGVGGFADNVSKYQAANVIEGPNGFKAATYSAPYANTLSYITSSAESPEACFAFLMTGFSDEKYHIMARYGQEGLDWAYCTDGEKGLYEDLGFPAVFKWLRGDIRKIEGQTSVWGGANIYTLPVMTKNEVLYYVDPVENIGAAMTAATTIAQAPYAPQNVVTKIIYTQEESDKTSELRSVLKTYVKEARTRFVAGDLDPEKDWDAYIQELNNIQYQMILETDRAAYHRTIGK